MYVGGYDPMKILEGLMNLMINKSLMTKAEADAIIAAAKAPDS
jgi:hypothetical protein